VGKPARPHPIDPETRDIVQNTLHPQGRELDGELYNVEFQTFEAVKDPAHQEVI